MAILDQRFTQAFQTAEANSGFDPIPPGDYILQVSETELKNTKNGSGQYIKVAFTVMGPKYEGRKIFTNFNIRNASPEAERIGVSQLKALVVAGGVAEPLMDTDQLVGATVSARVTVDKSDDPQYDDQNRVSHYKPVNAPGTGAMPGVMPMSTPANVPSAGTFSQVFGRQAAPEPSPVPPGQSWFK